MKHRVEVVIAGNRLTMVGEQDEEYMTKIAQVVDDRVSQLRESGAPTLQAITLTACDLADSYMQSVQGAENLRHEIAKYLSDNKTLEHNLADANSEIDALHEAAAKRSQEMKEVDRFKARIAELEQQLTEAMDFETRSHELEESLKQAESDVEQMQEMAQAEEIKCSELAEQLRSANAHIEQAEAEASEHKEHIGQLAGELDSVRTDLNTAHGKLDSCEHRIGELELQLEDADKRHADDLAQAGRMAQEMQQLRVQCDKAEAMQARIAELESELASTQKQLTNASERLSRLLK